MFLLAALYHAMFNTFNIEVFMRIVFLLLIMVASTAFAGSRTVKCGQGFARTGDLKYEVVEKCGDPLQIEKVSGDDNIKIERATYKISGWIYSFLYVGGAVDSITRLKRG